MNTRYILAAMSLMLAPAFAGAPSVVEAPLPTPTPAPAAAPFTVEIGVSNNFAARDIMKHADWGDSAKVDTIGADITFVHELDENNSVNLRLSYAWGHGSLAERDEWGVYKERNRMHSIAIMPGYRYTQALAGGLSCFVGVNVGVANNSLKFADIWADEEGSEKEKLHDSAWGFAYSAEAGLRYALSETTDLFVAYQFSGSTAKPSLSYGEGDSYKTRDQLYHGVRAGVAIKF